MSFKLTERVAYGDERTQGTIGVFSHSEGSEGEPPPRQGSQRDLDHYVTVLLAGVWRRGSVLFLRSSHPCEFLRPRSPKGPRGQADDAR